MSSAKHDEKDCNKSVAVRGNKRDILAETYDDGFSNGNPSSEDLPTDDEVEIEVTSSTLINANIHLPHIRSDCGIYSYEDGCDDNAKFCPNCYCYVCDDKVEMCSEWENSHCQANPNHEDWRGLRTEKQFLNRDKHIIDLSTGDDDSNSPSPQHHHVKAIKMIAVQQEEIRKYIQEDLQNQYSSIMTKKGELIINGDIEITGKRKRSNS